MSTVAVTPDSPATLKLDHLRHMTDETGMLQHAVFTVPNCREGYATDDNARALLVSTLLEALGSEEALDLAHRYLAFIWYSYNPETGRFRNFMDYQRRWLEDAGSDDKDMFLRTLRCHAAASCQDGCAARSTKERAARHVKTHCFSRVPAQAVAEEAEAAEPGRHPSPGSSIRPRRSASPEAAEAVVAEAAVRQ